MSAQQQDGTRTETEGIPLNELEKALPTTTATGTPAGQVSAAGLLPFHMRFNERTGSASKFIERATLVRAILPTIFGTIYDYYSTGPPIKEWDLKYTLLTSIVRQALLAGRRLGGPGTLPNFVGNMEETPQLPKSLPNDISLSLESSLRPSKEVIEFLRIQSPGEWPLPTVERTDLPIHAEWIRMTDGTGNKDRVILHLHGGAYVKMSASSHRPITMYMARASKSQVFSVNYRLAPQHPFPCGLIDALSAYLWLVGEGGYDPKKIVIMGDSAGGGLAMAVTLALKDWRKPMPGGVYLQSPWMDLSHSFLGSLLANEKSDYTTDMGPDSRKMGRFHYYTEDAYHNDPYVSPFFGNYTPSLPSGRDGGEEEIKMSPLLIQVGGGERLYDEIVASAQKGVGEGVEHITLETYEGAIHVFQMFMRISSASRVAMTRAGEWIHQVQTRSLPGKGREVLLNFLGELVSTKSWADLKEEDMVRQSNAELYQAHRSKMMMEMGE